MHKWGRLNRVANSRWGPRGTEDQPVDARPEDHGARLFFFFFLKLSYFFFFSYSPFISILRSLAACFFALGNFKAAIAVIKIYRPGEFTKEASSRERACVRACALQFVPYCAKERE